MNMEMFLLFTSLCIYQALPVIFTEYHMLKISEADVVLKGKTMEILFSVNFSAIGKIKGP